MVAPVFTILLPTTGDRAALVEIAMRQVLRQTLAGFQLIIVGDGVSGTSVGRLKALEAVDPRIRFRPFPKGERRGELYRHEILTHEVQSKYVAYLTDRDLWLEHHLETLAEGLCGADFVHTIPLTVGEDGEMSVRRRVDLNRPRHRRAVAKDIPGPLAMMLSGVGHRLAAYRQLPEGWSAAPPREFTDLYMWKKFFRQDWVRARSLYRATFLYFNRGRFPGPPVAERAAELAEWEPRVEAERLRAYRGFYEAAISSMYRSRIDDYERTRNPACIARHYATRVINKFFGPRKPPRRPSGI